MSFDVHQMGSLVPESYSRQLDERVAREEKPYGYTNEPPPADTRDFDQARLESRKKYSISHGKIN
jgi:hypothetical protein